jgi:predicted phage terminase large subunit-like protein
MTWQTWTPQDLLAARIETDRELVLKGGLYDFVTMAWSVIEPSGLTANWHLEEVCVHLEAVSRGDILRLVINQPPGSGKSSLVNVFWPVWEWVLRPATKFIYASYDRSLVGTRDGGKVIKLLQAPWFKARWGELLEPGKPAASWFNNVHGGFRFATSVAGGATGRHSDIQVVDDPIKPKDAAGGATFSKNQIRAVSEWWSGTMSTRAANQATFRRVIVMQRLCYDDLAGEMLATGDYTHLRLPMRYNPAKPCRTTWGGDRRTEKGTLLFPARFPEHAVTRLETKEMTKPQAAAQLQQEPQVEGGGAFQRVWFRFWHIKPGVVEPCLCDDCWNAEKQICGKTGPYLCAPLPPTGHDVQSWDFTFDATDSSDFVAGGVIRTVGLERHFLLDCINERLNIIGTMAALQTMTRQYPKALDKLIENKANGPAVVTLLKNKVPGVTLVEPAGSKPARASVASVAFSGGDFYLPHPDLAPWVWMVMKQLEGFPKASYDDLVDMISQAVVQLRKHGSGFSEAMRRLREGR